MPETTYLLRLDQDLKGKPVYLAVKNRMNLVTQELSEATHFSDRKEAERFKQIMKFERGFACLVGVTEGKLHFVRDE